MSNLGNGIIGFFGGESSGGGGTSTGVNGLNGTTSIGLGGNLNQNTIINGAGTYNLYFGDDSLIDRISYFKIRSIALDIENQNTSSIAKIYADSNFLYLRFFDNTNSITSQLDIKGSLIETIFDDGILSAQEGFYLDFSVRQYIFGGTDALINCDSINQKIIFNTKGLQLDGLTLNSGVTTPSANSIPITINSIQYYILLAT